MIITVNSITPEPKIYSFDDQPKSGFLGLGGRNLEIQPGQVAFVKDGDDISYLAGTSSRESLTASIKDKRGKILVLGRDQNIEVQWSTTNIRFAGGREGNADFQGRLRFLQAAPGNPHPYLQHVKMLHGPELFLKNLGQTLELRLGHILAELFATVECQPSGGVGELSHQMETMGLIRRANTELKKSGLALVNLVPVRAYCPELEKKAQEQKAREERIDLRKEDFAEDMSQVSMDSARQKALSEQAKQKELAELELKRIKITKEQETLQAELKGKEMQDLVGHISKMREIEREKERAQLKKEEAEVKRLEAEAERIRHQLEQQDKNWEALWNAHQSHEAQLEVVLDKIEALEKQPPPVIRNPLEMSVGWQAFSFNSNVELESTNSDLKTGDKVYGRFSKNPQELGGVQAQVHINRDAYIYIGIKQAEGTWKTLVPDPDHDSGSHFQRAGELTWPRVLGDNPTPLDLCWWLNDEDGFERFIVVASLEEIPFEDLLSSANGRKELRERAAPVATRGVFDKKQLKSLRNKFAQGSANSISYKDVLDEIQNAVIGDGLVMHEIIINHV